MPVAVPKQSRRQKSATSQKKASVVEAENRNAEAVMGVKKGDTQEIATQCDAHKTPQIKGVTGFVTAPRELASWLIGCVWLKAAKLVEFVVVFIRMVAAEVCAFGDVWMIRKVCTAQSIHDRHDFQGKQDKAEMCLRADEADSVERSLRAIRQGGSVEQISNAITLAKSMGVASYEIDLALAEIAKQQTRTVPGEPVGFEERLERRSEKVVDAVDGASTPSKYITKPKGTKRVGRSKNTQPEGLSPHAASMEVDANLSDCAHENKEKAPHGIGSIFAETAPAKFSSSQCAEAVPAKLNSSQCFMSEPEPEETPSNSLRQGALPVSSAVNEPDLSIARASVCQTENAHILPMMQVVSKNHNQGIPSTSHVATEPNHFIMQSGVPPSHNPHIQPPSQIPSNNHYNQGLHGAPHRANEPNQFIAHTNVPLAHNPHSQPMLPMQSNNHSQGYQSFPDLANEPNQFITHTNVSPTHSLHIQPMMQSPSNNHNLGLQSTPNAAHQPEQFIAHASAQTYNQQIHSPPVTTLPGTQFQAPLLQCQHAPPVDQPRYQNQDVEWTQDYSMSDVSSQPQTQVPIGGGQPVQYVEVAVPMGMELPEGAIPVGIVGATDRYANDSSPNQAMPIGIHHEDRIEWTSSDSVFNLPHAPPMPPNLCVSSTEHETPADPPKHGASAYKIIDPRTGKNVIVSGNVESSVETRRLRIVNPHTGEEVLPKLNCK